MQKTMFAIKHGVSDDVLAGLTPREQCIRILHAYDVDDNNAAFDMNFAYDDAEARHFLAEAWDYIVQDWPECREERALRCAPRVPRGDD